MTSPINTEIPGMTLLLFRVRNVPEHDISLKDFKIKSFKAREIHFI